MRTDALVDCGNALSGLADLTEHPGEALELLGEAVEAYRAALAQEEDAIVSPPPLPPLLYSFFF
jgi:hypothetical protein